MLSDVADHLGLSLPTTSKLVDTLVSGKMVSRKSDPADRRRMILVLTAAGERKYGVALEAATQLLVSKVAALSDEQHGKIVEAMKLLRSVFSAAPVDPSLRGSNEKDAKLRTMVSPSQRSFSVGDAKHV